MLDVAPIRAEPDAGAEQVTQALRGEPLDVAEVRGDWALVRTAYGYPGWIALDALGALGSDPWLPPRRSGEPLDEAWDFLGAPYEWGGLTAAGIDCSGLVHMAYRRLGMLVPRDAHQQEAAAVPVAESELRRGDLVFYGEAGRADHVAFWLDEGRILHATGREGVAAVVAEPEPESLRSGPRRGGRFQANP